MSNYQPSGFELAITSIVCLVGGFASLIYMADGGSQTAQFALLFLAIVVIMVVMLVMFVAILRASQAQDTLAMENMIKMMQVNAMENASIFNQTSKALASTTQAQQRQIQNAVKISELNGANNGDLVIEEPEFFFVPDDIMENVID